MLARVRLAVDVVDGERDAVHADLVGQCGVRLDRVGHAFHATQRARRAPRFPATVDSPTFSPVNTSILTPTDAREIARHVGRLVREHYVFADQAEEIAESILRAADEGAYDRCADAAEIARKLTDDLQAVNGDGHLRVLYNDEPLVDLSDPAEELGMWTAAADGAAGGMAKVEILPGNIGLLEVRPVLYPAILSGDRIAAAMTLVATCDALILDARGCVGGSPDSVALLCSYLFDDEPVHINSMRSRDEAKVVQSWTQAWVPGRRFGSEKPVVVLTSAATFSGGEELAYDLQQLGRARVVGEQTGGGANPREGHRVHEHLEATIPVAYPVNPVSGTNWELVGVTPDVPSPSEGALERALDELGQR